MRDPESHPVFRIVLAVIVLLSLVVLPSIDASINAHIRALEAPRAYLTKGEPEQ